MRPELLVNIAAAITAWFAAAALATAMLQRRPATVRRFVCRIALAGAPLLLAGAILTNYSSPQAGLIPGWTVLPQKPAPAANGPAQPTQPPGAVAAAFAATSPNRVSRVVTDTVTTAPNQVSTATPDENEHTPSAIGAASQTPAKAAATVDWLGLILLLAGAISLLLVVLTLGRQVLTLRWRRKLSDAAPAWVSLARRVASRVGLARPFEVLEAEELLQPAAVGVLRPGIVIPTESPQIPSAAARGVLAHELGHIKANDPLWELVGRLALALTWWCPAAWWMVRQSRIESESSADDLALEGGARPDELARTLACFAARTTATPLAITGMAGHLTRRITMIMNPKCPHATRVSLLARTTAAAAACMLAAAFATVPLLSSSGCSQPQAQQPAPAPELQRPGAPVPAPAPGTARNAYYPKSAPATAPASARYNSYAKPAAPAPGTDRYNYYPKSAPATAPASARYNSFAKPAAPAPGTDRYNYYPKSAPATAPAGNTYYEQPAAPVAAPTAPKASADQARARELAEAETKARDAAFKDELARMDEELRQLKAKADKAPEGSAERKSLDDEIRALELRIEKAALEQAANRAASTPAQPSAPGIGYTAVDDRARELAAEEAAKAREAAFKADLAVMDEELRQLKAKADKAPEGSAERKALHDQVRALELRIETKALEHAALRAAAAAGTGPIRRPAAPAPPAPEAPTTATATTVSINGTNDVVAQRDSKILWKYTDKVAVTGLKLEGGNVVVLPSNAVLELATGKLLRIDAVPTTNPAPPSPPPAESGKH